MFELDSNSKSSDNRARDGSNVTTASEWREYDFSALSVGQAVGQADETDKEVAMAAAAAEMDAEVGDDSGIPQFDLVLATYTLSQVCIRARAHTRGNP